MLVVQRVVEFCSYETCSWLNVKVQTGIIITFVLSIGVFSSDTSQRDVLKHATETAAETAAYWSGLNGCSWAFHVYDTTRDMMSWYWTDAELNWTKLNSFCTFRDINKNETRSLTVAKIADRTVCQWPLKSSKVNDFHLVWQGICQFLVFISHRFRHMASFPLENQHFSISVYSTPSLEMFSLE